MRSHNEVIQVRCVEIKLKVDNNNINNNNINRRRERRSAGTKTEEKESIYSVVLQPLGCRAVSRPISDFPLFPPAVWICDHRHAR